MGSSIAKTFSKPLATIIFLASTLLASASVLAEPTLSYDCSFSLPLTSIYPPERKDPNSDGVFRVEAQLRTVRRRTGTVYRLWMQKSWPVLAPNAAQGSVIKPLARRGNAYRVDALRFRGPLRNSLPATFDVPQSELFTGGACSGCKRTLEGSCSKAAE